MRLHIILILCLLCAFVPDVLGNDLCATGSHYPISITEVGAVSPFTNTINTDRYMARDPYEHAGSYHGPRRTSSPWDTPSEDDYAIGVVAPIGDGTIFWLILCVIIVIRTWRKTAKAN